MMDYFYFRTRGRFFLCVCVCVCDVCVNHKNNPKLKTTNTGIQKLRQKRKIQKKTKKHPGAIQKLHLIVLFTSPDASPAE